MFSFLCKSVQVLSLRDCEKGLLFKARKLTFTACFLKNILPVMPEHFSIILTKGDFFPGTTRIKSSIFVIYSLSAGNIASEKRRKSQFSTFNLSCSSAGWRDLSSEYLVTYSSIFHG